MNKLCSVPVFSIIPEEFVNIRKRNTDLADSVVSSDKSLHEYPAHGNVARQSHPEVTHHIILMLFIYVYCNITYWHIELIHDHMNPHMYRCLIMCHSQGTAVLNILGQSRRHRKIKNYLPTTKIHRDMYVYELYMYICTCHINPRLCFPHFFLFLLLGAEREECLKIRFLFLQLETTTIFY